MTLHRAILRAYDYAFLDPSLRHGIRTAATRCLISTIDLIKQLKPAHLQSFWYFASKHNLALIGTLGGLLWSTSDTAREREIYKVAMAEYRWTLRISSTGAAFMKQAIAAVDASPVFAATAGAVHAVPNAPHALLNPSVQDGQDSPAFDPSALQLDSSLHGWFGAMDTDSHTQAQAQTHGQAQNMMPTSDGGDVQWGMYV